MYKLETAVQGSLACPRFFSHVHVCIHVISKMYIYRHSPKRLMVRSDAFLSVRIPVRAATVHRNDTHHNKHVLHMCYIRCMKLWYHSHNFCSFEKMGFCMNSTSSLFRVANCCTMGEVRLQRYSGRDHCLGDIHLFKI